ncbi:unnamed protein product [Cunninghamella blakesleeana]
MPNYYLLLPQKPNASQQAINNKSDHLQLLQRKIGLQLVINIQDDVHKEEFVNGVNDVVEYNRDVIIKIHPFINYYLYNKLSNGQPTPRSLYTQSFFYAVFQLITTENITFSNTIKGKFLNDIQVIFNQYKTMHDDVKEPLTHGGKSYDCVLASAAQE